MMIVKQHLLGMNSDELKEVADKCGLPGFTAKQITEWIYKKRVTDIGDMTNISKSNRITLSQHYDIGLSPYTDKQLSSDGTVKYLFKIDENRFIETVMIPDADRYTLCISSQVGCKFGCLFCMTGKQGFSGNLSSNEILNQIFAVDEAMKLTNIVFMGMGEPLDNYSELIKTIQILTSGYGLEWSPKRITVSTTGILPNLKRLLNETNVHIAISIHNAFPEQREVIMPVEKAYPIDDIIGLLKEYDWTKQRRLSFEYIMFDKVNDSLLHARELSSKLKGLECRVNLIRFHSIPGIKLTTSSNDKMVAFRDYLNKKGIMCTIRTSRGEDIFAACGMLSTEKNKKQNIQL